MMLAKRLFRFGFENPREAKINASEGTGYESSTGIWIISQSDDDATEWGKTIAERLVIFLFNRAQIVPYSWTDAGFAHWIEQDPEALPAASYLPSVSVGEMPDLAVLAADAAYD
ncbi:hypothetical protein GS397_03350 [Sphingobium yanoikuyae]|uniref:Uncharacterized protein n=1 Tax=Sphingobium yanoikuyae TaxID=13690 RepID=A0A6P1GDE9_SPHYA|nr:hypothetical protein [Sphingobium yanoikuyae]MBD3817135.1 hypothetical protein [Halothiobacillus sp.]QHD66203.1 hypothetical protein GS397_03350 [Sphingobium yanoikuyae]